MRHKTDIFVKTVALVFSLFILAFLSAAQQPVQRRALPRQKMDLGKEMSSINTGLIQIGAQTGLFLQFAEQVGLTVEQKKKLEEIYFEEQKFDVRQEADLDVADAELRRLLSNDQVDLPAVRLKVKEIQALRTEETIKRIEAVLQAISVLTHEQHIKLLLLIRNQQTIDSAAAPVS